VHRSASRGTQHVLSSSLSSLESQRNEGVVVVDDDVEMDRAEVGVVGDYEDLKDNEEGEEGSGDEDGEEDDEDEDDDDSDIAGSEDLGGSVSNLIDIARAAFLIVSLG
jgi:hypothetical protein